MGVNGSNLVSQYLMNDDLATTEVLDNFGSNNGTAQQNTDQMSTTGKINEALLFNGLNDYISVPTDTTLNFGTEEFAIGAWIYTDTNLDDTIGDIISKFDKINKKGFIFNVKHNAGSMGSQTNFRQLSFGIDNDHPDTIWIERAPKLGAEDTIISLAVYNGKLYGGTGQNGKLYEWNGTNAWVEKAPKLGNETRIWSLAVYNGKLYGGTYPNGELYEWNGTDAWIKKADQFTSNTYIQSLAVYNGKLYGGTVGWEGKLLEWNGTDAWIEKAPTLGGNLGVYSLAVYNGKLYGGMGWSRGELYEWNGTNAWVEKADWLGSEPAIWSLAVYNGKLYGVTQAQGKLYEWNGTNAWILKATSLGSTISTIAVYNGSLYASVYGKLYEWKGTGGWIERAPKLGTEDSVMTLTVYNGKLYGGTDPNGKLFEWKTGKAVTYDYELDSGWQHVFAVKDNSDRKLKLYLNGSKVAESDTFVVADYNLDNSEDLLIGFGVQDYFNGKIDDIRIYNKAITSAEISLIYNEGIGTEEDIQIFTYRTNRRIEASIIDFLTDNFNNDWTNVNIEKTLARVYAITLPTICVRTNVTSHNKVEIGEDSTTRTVQVLIDIFATSDGQKLDLADYIAEKIKSGCVYYDYIISDGEVQSKNANGRIRVTSIEVTPIDFDTDKDKLDVHDRYRSLITLEISLGRVEN